MTLSEPGAAMPGRSRRTVARWGGVGLALLIGLLIRAPYVLHADFPLADGGLFALMIDGVRSDGYRLPWSVDYNGTAVPFVYPPLAFFLAAFLADILLVQTIAVLQYLPLVLNLLTILAFAVLASVALRGVLAPAIATLIFVIMPGSYVWLIVGGGLTRSLGFLFALLGLCSALAFYRTGSPRSWLAMTVLCALTVLSHPAMALFLAFSVPLVFVAFGRGRKGLVASGAAALAILVLTSPWWGVILLRHGPAPALAASQTGSLLSFAVSGASSNAEILTSQITVGILVLLCYVLAFVRRGLLFVLCWMGLIFLLDLREALWLFTVPIALALGQFLGWLIERAGYRVRKVAVSSSSAPTERRRGPDYVLAALVVLATGYFGAMVSMGYMTWAPDVLRPLSEGERAAMRWVHDETSSEDRFLVVAGHVWAGDRSSEWFPVLARRVSVATPQGLEWIPKGGFLDRVAQHIALQDCTRSSADCISRWQQSTGREFNHVYIARDPHGDCCEPLRASLARDPAYRLVYDGPGATIFRAQQP